jgi:hypothetical protein
MGNLQHHFSKTALRHYVRIAAFVVLGMSVGAFFMLTFLSFTPSQTPRVADEIKVELPVEQRFLERSEPILLRVPKVNLEVEFEAPLGLNEDKTIEVPDSYEKVGWYKNGASPGEKGPAIILGHVDSYQGPAIFYGLKELEPGDEVFVVRSNGSTATFVVDRAERYAQDEFPTEKVYGATEGAELRLITCTGTFDKGEQRYSHNLVVYATLKE